MELQIQCVATRAAPLRYFVSTRIRTILCHPALLCTSALILCILVTRPVLNMGMDDDWSYVWCSRTLADTGHILYNGYVEPMLGWQLYLGALFIKVFGFSFTALRVSTLLVAIAAIILTQQLFVRFGITSRNSTIATLTIALSPVFLLLSFSFMSDIGGYFSLVLCLYACVRAVQSTSNWAALAWLAFAAISNVITGTARQTGWLGALILVPCAAWLMRKRPGALLTGALLWIASVLAILACLHWFNSQPYSISSAQLKAEQQNAVTLIDIAKALVQSFLALGLLISPVLVGFLARYPTTHPVVRRRGILLSALFLLGVLALALRHKVGDLLAPFLVGHGALLGIAPPVLPLALRITLTIITFATLLAFVLCVMSTRSLPDIASDITPQLPWQAIATLLGPVILGYVAFLVTREVVFERYLLPLLFLTLIPILRFYQQKVASELPSASVLLVLFMALYGVIIMHDLFAGHRARLQAANELRDAGVPRTQFRAGVEYDGWTQLETTGYINERRIHNPAGAYHPWTAPASISHDCVFAFSSDVPSIVARYNLSLSPQSPCGTLSQFTAVPYTTWMPPHQRAIYVIEEHP
jgi:hypothetical protein